MTEDGPLSRIATLHKLLSSSLLSRHVTVRSLRSLPVPFVTEGSGKGREEDGKRL